MKFKLKPSTLCFYLFFISISFYSSFIKAQSNETFKVVEQMPVFKGGEEKMYQFLSTNIMYPAYCRENAITGRVIAQFIVTSTGKIDSIKILSSPHKAMSDECIRVLNSMPNWTPGKQNGENVNVEITLPLSFQLDECDAPKRKKFLGIFNRK